MFNRNNRILELLFMLLQHLLLVRSLISGCIYFAHVLRLKELCQLVQVCITFNFLFVCKMMALKEKSRAMTEMLFASLDLKVTNVKAQGNFSVLLSFFQCCLLN